MAMRSKQCTLLLLHTAKQVLLGMKKKGFGAGKYNGFGGKIEPGETILAAAQREMWEESGLRVKDTRYAGRVIFEFEGNPELLEVHIFKGTKYEGEPTESDEMKPQWFAEDAIPYDSMWKDDAYWLPLLLRNQMFDAFFLFRGHETILSQKIDFVSKLPYDPEKDVLVHAEQAPLNYV